MLDISGYNYQWQNYLTDHKKYPARIMYGSESFPKEAYENWQLVKTQPYVIGDFVWTGMDYIGESGIGHGDYFADPGKSTSFLRPWPWYLSWCGDIDITGNKKPQSYYRDVLWDQSNLELLVHEPVSDGMYEATSLWGWPLEYKSWNWSGHEGDPLQVNVYSTYPEVRLELNGKLIDQKSIPPSARNTASFTVPYAAGELRAIGIRGGEDQESQSIASTGPIWGLKLISEDSILIADRGAIAYIRVIGTDSKDEKVPHAVIPLHIEVTGEGELLAAGNASPLIQGSLQDKEFNLFRGEALVIIRSTGKAGFITLEVSSGHPVASAQTIISVQ
jgi:beta-galactosidase